MAYPALSIATFLGQIELDAEIPRLAYRLVGYLTSASQELTEM